MRIGETNKLSLDEASEGLQEKALTKSCYLCSKQSVCAIFGLFKSGIEQQFPDAIKTENLAWVCNEYDEKVNEAQQATTGISKKVLRRL